MDSLAAVGISSRENKSTGSHTVRENSELSLAWLADVPIGSQFAQLFHKKLSLCTSGWIAHISRLVTFGVAYQPVDGVIQHHSSTPSYTPA